MSLRSSLSTEPCSSHASKVFEGTRIIRDANTFRPSTRRDFGAVRSFRGFRTFGVGEDQFAWRKGGYARIEEIRNGFRDTTCSTSESHVQAEEIQNGFPHARLEYRVDKLEIGQVFSVVLSSLLLPLRRGAISLYTHVLIPCIGGMILTPRNATTALFTSLDISQIIGERKGTPPFPRVPVKPREDTRSLLTQLVH